MVSEGINLYIVPDGVKIAKRGPDRTWISLEPGCRVFDAKGGRELVVEHDGVPVH
jgi:hypothetical protein